MDAAADGRCRHGEQLEADQARVAVLCVHWDTSGVLPAECPAAAAASLSGCPQGEAPMIPARFQECSGLGLLSPVRGCWRRISESAPIHLTVNGGLAEYAPSPLGSDGAGPVDFTFKFKRRPGQITGLEGNPKRTRPWLLFRAGRDAALPRADDAPSAAPLAPTRRTRSPSQWTPEVWGGPA
jgi:hypothetical protein